MGIVKSDKIWMNGRWVAWDDAKIHVLSHAMHYASSVFEGIRCYTTPRGPAVFRLDDHIQRLLLSARIYRMELPFSGAQIREACLELVALNGLEECYIRPLVYRGYENLGVNPFGNPIDVAIAAYPWGKYLGEDALNKGVAARVSSWHRMAPNTMPAMAKASSNYMNSQLMKMEALVDGYAEAIALDVNGMVSEGSGQNVFAVIRGEIMTPPLSSSILAGITRDSVITLARDMGYTVREEPMPREQLYAAEELFYSGTAVEVTPITSVDRIAVGEGARGPVTEAVQKAFFGVVRGEAADRHGWLTPVRARAGAAAPAVARHP
jgi:branched-chain amino acid aminotransferase